MRGWRSRCRYRWIRGPHITPTGDICAAMLRPLSFTVVRVAYIAPVEIDVMTRVAYPVTVLGRTALRRKAFPDNPDPRGSLLRGFVHQVSLVKGGFYGDMLPRGIS